MSSKPRVAIVMGSDSDWKVMSAAKELLSHFEVSSISRVVSAHRTPEDLGPYVKEMEDLGVCAVIAGAGGAAHLPGMLASYSTLPVIGVPVATTSLNGMDSLLSIVQMPKGIPVATVAIDNATNAALLALRILGTTDLAIRARLVAYRKELAENSRSKTKNLK
jgi:5-(carboxyamino)imidazole ribonucleotide mutase